MKFLAADIGNSSVVIGAFEGDSLSFSFRIATKKKWTVPSVRETIRLLIQKHEAVPADFTGSILSSVVPDLTPILAEALKKITGESTLVLSTKLPPSATGIDLSRYDAESLGVDRLVDMAAARELTGGGPFMLCDFGTATTLSVVDCRGVMTGGMICAGMQLSLNILSQEAAQLPELTVIEPRDLLGRDTVACMLNGAVIGQASMVEGIFDRISSQVPGFQDADRIITGGYSRFALPYFTRPVRREPDLLMKGLGVLYRTCLGDGSCPRDGSSGSKFC